VKEIKTLLEKIERTYVAERLEAMQSLVITSTNNY